LPLEVTPLLVVLSGPSGVGKDAVLTRLREWGHPYHFAVTVTTRPRREREREAADYHFVSPARFQEMVESKELLEWAKVYDNWYGVPRQQLQQALERGQDVIVKVDVQGAATIKSLMPQAAFIFLVPPSMEEMEERLRQRHTESTPDLALRLEAAREEMKRLSMFDYVVVNHQDRVDWAASQIEAIIKAEKCRVSPRVIKL
jgi:guanylate kinase